ncbi:hypothetical protein CRUP_026191, partial [Coryphaenoides rupestris]
CRVDKRRRIIPLKLTSLCPSAIRACLDVGRSSIYVRPTVSEPGPEVQTEVLADDTLAVSSDSQTNRLKEEDRSPGVNTRSRSPRVRLVNIRFGLIPDGRDSIYMPRPGTTVRKLVVPLSWSETEFIERIRQELPQVR